MHSPSLQLQAETLRVLGSRSRSNFHFFHRLKTRLTSCHVAIEFMFSACLIDAPELSGGFCACLSREELHAVHRTVCMHNVEATLQRSESWPGIFARGSSCICTVLATYLATERVPVLDLASTREQDWRGGSRINLH